MFALRNLLCAALAVSLLFSASEAEARFGKRSNSSNSEEKEEKKGEEVVRSERYYGKVSRSFSLPVEVDEAKAVAKYADGVLNLALPVKAKASARKLTIG